MFSTTSFIKNVLPGGCIPENIKSGDTLIKVPFAIMELNEDEENEVDYQDLPSDWFICAAFESREEAEEQLAKLSEDGGCYMIVENQTEPLYEFCHLSCTI